MIERRPRAYADENVDARIVEALRERGFEIVTARDVRMLGQTDDAQLAYAADQGRVLLTFDRGDFRRLHARFVEAGREHAGIALLPQSRLIARTIVRAAMMLDWLATLEHKSSPLVNWNDLQARLHRGERLPGYEEDEVAAALGQVTWQE